LSSVIRDRQPAQGVVGTELDHHVAGLVLREQRLKAASARQSVVSPLMLALTTLAASFCSARRFFPATPPSLRRGAGRTLRSSESPSDQDHALARGG
jgi:hypothetical protein